MAAKKMNPFMKMKAKAKGKMPMDDAGMSKKQMAADMKKDAAILKKKKK